MSARAVRESTICGLKRQSAHTAGIFITLMKQKEVKQKKVKTMKSKAIIGYLLIAMVAVTDLKEIPLNAIIFGFAVCLCYEWSVKWLTIGVIKFVKLMATPIPERPLKLSEEEKSQLYRAWIDGFMRLEAYKTGKKAAE
jgi:formate-dependent nitrite reductase membrane component NrfD